MFSYLQLPEVGVGKDGQWHLTSTGQWMVPGSDQDHFQMETSDF